ncbi:aromatic acid/H+ symport family MFS transporter [Roseomonas mucosa]|nr:aromatic acid/H+ symport family MFS transporter [Roseomonas mucosa]
MAVPRASTVCCARKPRDGRIWYGNCRSGPTERSAPSGAPNNTDHKKAAMGTVVVNTAFILFAIPLSFILPKVDARRILLAMFGLGVALCIGLAKSGENWTMVFILIAASGFGIGGQQIALNYLVSGIYPAELRATGTGWTIGIGRTGAIIGSAAGGWLLQLGGPSGYYLALAMPLVVAGLAVAIIQMRHTPTRSRSVSAAH